MKISKEGSADFLFGNTKKINNMDNKSKLPETRSKIIDGLIILVLLSQVIYLGISPYIYQNFLSVNFEINYFILFAIIIYSVIEALKNFFQLSNFGENEFNQSKFSILFMIIQGAISYSFVWILYMILDILIGDNCDIAAFVSINVADSHKRCIGLSKKISRKKIVLEKNVFVGTFSVIKSGATIGHHSVIAAGTVVDGKKIPPYSLVSGNPMKIKKGYYKKFK